MGIGDGVYLFDGNSVPIRQGFIQDFRLGGGELLVHQQSAGLRAFLSQNFF